MDSPRDMIDPPPDQASGDLTPIRPRDLDLKKDRALTIRWADGRISIYPIAYLRKMSPSADARALRDEMKSNPLTVLPAAAAGADTGPLTATAAELVGNYALRITFSDGHDTGIYSWAYLRQIAPPPEAPPPEAPPPEAPPPEASSPEGPPPESPPAPGSLPPGV